MSKKEITLKPKWMPFGVNRMGNSTKHKFVCTNKTCGKSCVVVLTSSKGEPEKKCPAKNNKEAN